MNEHQKQLLEQKKKQIQLKLKVKDFIKYHLQGFLPLLDALRQKQAPHRIVHLACVSEEELPFWTEELQNSLLQPYGFRPDQLLVVQKDPVHEEVSRRYPNTHPLRYVPALPLKLEDYEDAAAALQQAQAEMNIANQKVFFFITRFSPVLELPIEEVQQNATDLYDPMENIVLCSTDYSWLIYRTLEEDWHYGYAHQVESK